MSVAVRQHLVDMVAKSQSSISRRFLNKQPFNTTPTRFVRLGLMDVQLQVRSLSARCVEDSSCEYCFDRSAGEDVPD